MDSRKRKDMKEYAKKALEIFEAIENNGKRSAEEVAEAVKEVLKGWEAPAKYVREEGRADEEVTFGRSARSRHAANI